MRVTALVRRRQVMVILVKSGMRKVTLIRSGTLKVWMEKLRLLIWRKRILRIKGRMRVLIMWIAGACE